MGENRFIDLLESMATDETAATIHIIKNNEKYICNIFYNGILRYEFELNFSKDIEFNENLNSLLMKNFGEEQIEEKYSEDSEKSSYMTILNDKIILLFANDPKSQEWINNKIEEIKSRKKLIKK